MELAALLPYAPIALQFLGDDTYSELKTELRTWAKRDPIDALVATVVGGGLAFYLAEKDVNPNCKTPWDGILYMATSLSVGYDNLFPITPAGHALATFIQTFGPSLAANALEAPAAATSPVSPNLNLDPTAPPFGGAEARGRAASLAVLERLDRIVQLLEAKQ